MASSKIPTIRFRRKREGKTDYKKRLLLLKSRKSRLVIRKFNKNLIAQVVTYNSKGDVVESAVHSKELEKVGWKHSKNNIPAAYLTGLLLAKKTKAKEMVLDTGLQSSTKGSKLYACLKGCVDGGVNIPHSEDILPDEKRIKGEHISDKISKSFEDSKKKILGTKK